MRRKNHLRSRSRIKPWLSLVAQQVKDLVLSPLWCRFYPLPRNFHVPQCSQKKKKKKKKKGRRIKTQVPETMTFAALAKTVNPREASLVI